MSQKQVIIEPGLCFSLLQRADAPAVAALEQASFSLPWSAEQFSRALEQKAFNAFGLKQNDVVIAYISLYHTGDELEILNIAVTPEKRNTGLGTRLLGLVLRLAPKMGIVRSVLEVRPSNAAAIALYSTYGYKHEGRRPSYYPDTGEDALIYVLTFPCPEHQPARSLS